METESYNSLDRTKILTKRAIKNELKETYSIVQKDTKYSQNSPMETTIDLLA